MRGRKVSQEKFFYNFSLSERVPRDHILRRLNEVVVLSFVRGRTAPYYSHPSMDPVVLFKMMLLGYLYGITSERKLAEECSLPGAAHGGSAEPKAAHAERSRRPHGKDSSSLTMFCSGQLVPGFQPELGNSAILDSAWRGTVLGVLIKLVV